MAKMGKEQLKKVKKALQEAGLGDLMLDQYVESMQSRFGKDCPYGCSACCDSGTANRKGDVAVPRAR
jgi:hypothetical protein